MAGPRLALSGPVPPPRTGWSHLVVGIVCLAALVLGAAAILRYARVDALRGDTVRVYQKVGGSSPSGRVASDDWQLIRRGVA